MMYPLIVPFSRHYPALLAKWRGHPPPEERLYGAMLGAPLFALSAFWLGWTGEYASVHWIVPIISLLPLSIGLMGVWMPTMAYIIDAYPVYAASAIAAFTVLRSLVAAFLPLAGQPMFDAMGLGWGNSLLGFICIALIPMLVLINRYGTRIRKKFPLSL